jgi:hypothetical protein
MLREIPEAEPAIDQDGGPASDSASVAGSLGPTSQQRTTEFISKRQTTNLMAAFEFADAIGLPLSVSVDIAWIFFYGNAEDRTRFARCQQRLSKWAFRQGFPGSLLPIVVGFAREFGIAGLQG